MLKKQKLNEKIEFPAVYFNSTTKTVINYRFSLENAFQEVLCRFDNWTNKGFAWINELIQSQYIYISIYRPLSGSFYVKLLVELISPKKGLINIKKSDQKFFLWCHVIHINPVKIYPERIRQTDKELANDLDYDRIEFPMREKGFSKIETKKQSLY